MARYYFNLMLALLAGLNVAMYADHHEPFNLGVGVAFGIAALVQRPS